ncbi:GAK5 protein, partial [Pycnonotus jocosus]|nr:GAK5 protein [Pycnonotus jocosus]
MATTFAAAKGTSGSSAVCYGCGKPGHLKRDCFAQKGAKPKIPDVCPQCRKGRHFSNQCHSKYDSEGHSIQGNQNLSAGQHRAPTQMPQPPTQMVPPQMPTRQAQPPRTPSRGPPQVFA